MRTTPHPTLYEVDTRAWLVELGRRLKLSTLPTLDDVPDAELDRIAERGFDWVWLLGVWTTGRLGREVSLGRPDWLRHYQEILPDLTHDDVAGSVFAIQAYDVAPRLGGDPALARIRERLRERGVKLMLDFVPNHTAPDHPWVFEHPEYYVQGNEADLAREPDNYAHAKTRNGSAILAYGRDPYFPGWPDTFQLNYRHPGLREAMTAEFVHAAGRCDGLRCDMAMLLLPEVYLATWSDRALPADGAPPTDASFWPDSIERLRAEHPETFLLAEAYWDLEHPLQQLGFDATYDKRLYDKLAALDAPAVRGHLRADGEYQRRSARFLENHDEPRAAAVFSEDAHRAAALIAFLVPGLRLFHHGQLEGRRLRPSVHLARRPDDPTNPALSAFYDSLLAILRRPEPHEGDWTLLDVHRAWTDDPTAERLIAFEWRGPSDLRLLVAVNLSPTSSQGFIPLPSFPVDGSIVRFRDLLGPACYERESRDLAERGLYLDLPAWGHHAFTVEPGP